MKSHTSESQYLREPYEQWVRELTGLSLKVSSETIPPTEYLRFFDEKGNELFRVPALLVQNRRALQNLLPPHLQEGNPTFPQRRELLSVLTQNSYLLHELSLELEEFSLRLRRIGKSSLALGRLRQEPDAQSLAFELLRQIQEVVFSLDDTTVQLALQNLKRREHF